ncbi:rab effector MyRIP isoform X1 [Hydra vulgaris]|uniref:Rab effector MyRIP isoform X1 n=2 Tax=Hydra vulgaris TaxID=6087 RepID=A0ABM4C1R8_HYDVU
MSSKIARNSRMPDCSRNVDVSQLSRDECSHIINVIGKDIKIRKTEAERISELNKNLEDFRRSILLANINRKKRFPYDDFCLCGKHMFTFCCFITGEECASCENYCCSKCRETIVYKGEDGIEEFYICYLCCKKREAKQKSVCWFYETTEKRFKRFGSSKVLRAIYKENNIIDPRVITLLALCREIQPAKRMSFREMRRKVSSSNFITDNNYLPSISDQIEYRKGDQQLKMQPSLSLKSIEPLTNTNYETETRKNNILHVPDDSAPVIHFTLYSPVCPS